MPGDLPGWLKQQMRDEGWGLPAYLPPQPTQLKNETGKKPVSGGLRSGDRRPGSRPTRAH